MNILIKGLVLENVKMVSVDCDTLKTVVEFENSEARTRAAALLVSYLVFELFGNILLQFKESFSIIK